MLCPVPACHPHCSIPAPDKSNRPPMPVRRPSRYATQAAATSCTPLPLESKITSSSSVERPRFRPAARSARSAWTWSFDMTPARSAWLRSPLEAQASMSSTRMRARCIRSGAISCFFRFAGTNGRNETTGQVQIICKDRHVGRGACDADADACERRANARRTCDGAFG